MLFHLQCFQDQLGEQKLYQINCLDNIYCPKLKANLLIFGDASGRLSIVKHLSKEVKFLYHEQEAYNQLISLKWLSDSNHLTFCAIFSDGQAFINKLTSNGQKLELKRVCSLPQFEEVANQFNFASQQLRQSQTIQWIDGGDSLGIMWPERLIYKINKRTAEKKVILEKKLSVFKVTGLKKSTLLVAPQGVPLNFSELVPQINDQQLQSEPYVFFIDNYQMQVYHTYDGQKRTLFNALKESGID